MDYITKINGVQLENPVMTWTALTDDRYPWRERKMGTLKLAQLYDKGGYPRFAERARTCATWLEYNVDNSGRKLAAANFCQLRLCPMCIARRARRSAHKLSQVMDAVAGEYDARFVFLTLTVANVPGEELGAAIGQITSAWTRLIKHRQIERSVGGWFRAVEITREDKSKGRRRLPREMYHPHLHAILAVPPDYFSRKSGLYITQAEWVRRWQKALRVDYAPSVRVQVTKAKGAVSGGCAAALEAAKYTVKASDYIDDRLPEKRAVEILCDYTEALHRRRLTAFGGWLKEAAKELDAENLEDGDLVHVDDEAVREDVAELIEYYNWNFGAGDYILSGRTHGPLKVRRGGKDDGD